MQLTILLKMIPTTCRHNMRTAATATSTNTDITRADDGTLTTTITTVVVTKPGRAPADEQEAGPVAQDAAYATVGVRLADVAHVTGAKFVNVACATAH